MARLAETYIQSIRPSLQQRLGLKNLHQAPKLEKVVINVGVREAKDNPKLLEEIKQNLTLITGSQPVITKAKKSIAGFKTRAGQPVGLQVTLRGNRLYDFIDKLVNIALPRVRDFRGLSRKGFDGRGNYNLGIKEHVIFPEIHFEVAERLHGANITIVTSAQTDQDALLLLEEIGFPLAKEN